MAITSRSSFLTRQVASLTAQAAAARADGGEGDAWVEEQLGEAKERLARVQAQFKEWEVCAFFSD